MYTRSCKASYAVFFKLVKSVHCFLHLPYPVCALLYFLLELLHVLSHAIPLPFVAETDGVGKLRWASSTLPRFCSLFSIWSKILATPRSLAATKSMAEKMLEASASELGAVRME